MALNRFVWVLLLVGLLNSCHQQKKNAAPVEVPAKRTFPTIEELKGKSFEEAKRLLGRTIVEDEYYFKDAILGEFRVNLLNFFDQTDTSDYYKRIKEATWFYGLEEGRTKYLTIWYVQEGQRWTYLDLADYLEGVEF